MMAADTLTVLTSLGGKLATKVISQVEGRWWVEPYGRAEWFAVREVPVHDIRTLGQALAELERNRHSFVIRGEPLSTTDRSRCRRLLYDQLEDGVEVPATFEPAARRWLALDFDALPTPQWDHVHLARRREAIARDRAEHHEASPIWHVDDPGELPPELCADDLDPAPIDAVRDWSLVCAAAVATLPPEFQAVTAWWQMTSSAGIKPGVRIRLWFWLDRPVRDAEAKRWLEGCPVDPALYNPVQAHYVAKPIFHRARDPVPKRSGFFWRGANMVAVPELPEPAPPPRPERKPHSGHATARAHAYAEACLRAIAAAAPGDRHNTLRSTALRLFSLAAIGELDPADVRNDLLTAAAEHRWPERRATDLVAWAATRAYSNPQPPEGWR